MNVSKCRLISIGLFLAVCQAWAQTAAQSANTQGPRGVVPSGNYSGDNFESVDNVYGGVSYSVPLVSLPPGRGGMPFTLPMVYNSNFYDVFFGVSGQNLTNDLYVNGSGPWRYAYEYGLDLEIKPNFADGSVTRNCGNADNGYRYFRLSAVFPDGSHHLLRLYGGNDRNGDGFYQELPGTTPPCATAQTGNFVYYTIDGTYLKVVIDATTGISSCGSGGLLTWPVQCWKTHPWTFSFTDGRQVTGFGVQASSILDRNGNSVLVQNVDDLMVTSGGQATATLLQDDLGRQINIVRERSPDGGQIQDIVTAAGANGSALTWTVTWNTQNLSATQVNYLACSNAFSQAQDTSCKPGNFMAVTSIAFPTDAAGFQPRYQFGYSTLGWGQLNNVITPAGAATHYCYQYDSIAYPSGDPCYGTPTLSSYQMPLSPPRNPLLRKTLTWCDEFDLAAPVAPGAACPVAATAHSWNYTFGAAASSVTGPDGGVTTTSFTSIVPSQGTLLPDAGLVGSIVYPDGAGVARTWSHKTPYLSSAGSGQTGPNPYVSSETRTTAGTAFSAVKQFGYDLNGNLTAGYEYDWDGTLLRTVNQVILSAPQVTASQTDANAYWNPGSTGLRALVACRSVTGAGIGAVTEFVYDGTGNAADEFDWDSTKAATQPGCTSTAQLTTSNAVWKHSGPYQQGNLTDAVDGNGNHTHYSYDSSNLYLTTLYEAYGSASGLQRATSYNFDFNTGLESSETDYNGLTRSFTRDNLGRVVQVRESGAAGLLRATTTVYEDANRRVVTKADNILPGDQQLVAVTDYDQLGRMRLSRQLESAAGMDDDTVGIKVQTRYRFTTGQTYQVVSNPYRATSSALAGGEATMGWTVAASDWRYRVTSSTFTGGATPPSSPPIITGCSSAGSRVTCYTGKTSTSSDELLKARTNTVDALGRLTQVEETGIAATTTYVYDVLGNLTGVTHMGIGAACATPQLGTANRSFFYDSLGRLGKACNPESGSPTYPYTLYAYDNNSNLKTRTDGRNNQVTFYYDALNRLSDKAYNPTATPGVHYAYLGVQDFVSSVSSSASTYTYLNYDALGRPGGGMQATVNQPAYTFPSVVWTPGGQVRAMTYPSGRVVTTSFDGGGRIAGVTGVLNGTPATYVSGALYASHGGISQWSTGDQIGRTAAYNARLQTTAITAGAPLTLGLTWNTNGTLQSQTIARTGLASATQTYGYDDANRLKTAAETNSVGQPWAQTYVFDKVGNRAVTGNSSELANATTYTPHSSDGVTVPFDAGNHWSMVGVYDGAGNMTTVRTQTMGYDAESRMVSWADSALGTSASFTYDGDGRRLTKTAGSLTTVYVYDPAGNLAVEYGGVAPGGTSTVYLTRDHLGSTRLVTTAGGGCAGAHDYLPFGEEIPVLWGRGAVPCYGVATDTSVKFTGQEKDSETGLNDFLARQMAGPQGRFLSVDPDNAGADAGDPQSWNGYAYVRNNPLALVDPDGTTTCDANGNNCHDDVTVNGSSTEVDPWGAGNLLFDLFFRSALRAAQVAQEVQQRVAPVLRVINNFRQNSNCANALTAGGGLAGAGIGAQAGSGIGALAGAGAGTLALPGGGTIGGGAVGFGLGGLTGSYIGYSGGSAIGALGAGIFCSAGGGGGGGGTRQPASEKTAKDMASQIERDLGPDARRGFHDAKLNGAGDRTLAELKADAKAIYEAYGKSGKMPNWMR